MGNRYHSFIMSLFATKLVSAGSEPGKNVTFTCVSGSNASAKLSTLLAPLGVTSSDQLAAADDNASIVNDI